MPVDAYYNLEIEGYSDWRAQSFIDEIYEMDSNARYIINELGGALNETCWPLMEEVMLEMSLRHPGILFTVTVSDEYSEEYCAFFKNGMSYEITVQKLYPVYDGRLDAEK